METAEKEKGVAGGMEVLERRSDEILCECGHTKFDHANQEGVCYYPRCRCMKFK